MLILAVYYTLADIVLLGQCFYYRGFTLSDAPTKPLIHHDPADDEPLLSRQDSFPRSNGYTHHNAAAADSNHRMRSTSSFRDHLTNVDGTHLSPATPLLKASSDPLAAQNLKPTSTLQSILFNVFAIILVCAAGIFGWWVSNRSPRHAHQGHGQTEQERQNTLRFDLWGQIFGYLCAVLYLGSRVPQILLNWRRKSTEGVSLLFFLFACIGNLTYVMSIFAYEPACRVPGDCRAGEAAGLYGRYIAVNASWLIGSAGTLLLDLAIFGQFFLYRTSGDGDEVVFADEEEDLLRLGNGEGRGRGRRDER